MPENPFLPDQPTDVGNLMLQQLKEINAKLGYVTDQRKLPVSGQILITAVNSGIQFQQRKVPPDVPVTVRALPGNLGTIRIGGSRADVENASTGFPLVATDAPRDYHVHDLSDLWIAGTSPGDGIAWTFEDVGY